MYNVLWRTADTGEQRSVFAGWLGQGLPRRRFLISSKSNSLISAGKRGDPCFCLGYRPSPRVQPCCKFDQYILEGRWTECCFFISFSCGNAFAFLFASQKIRGYSPLVFKGCPSPLSATPTFPRTAGNHPAAFLKNCCTEKLFISPVVKLTRTTPRRDKRDGTR